MGGVVAHIKFKNQFILRLLMSCVLGMSSASAATNSLSTLEVANLLTAGQYAQLDKKLTALQQAFERDANQSEILLAGFDHFDEVHLYDLRVEHALNAWVEQFPNSYAAPTARGSFYLQQGWKERGGAYFYKTKPKNLMEMRHWFGKANKDLTVSLALTAKPFASHIKLMSLTLMDHHNDDRDNHYKAAEMLGCGMTRLILRVVTNISDD
jgi:Domain of unknown function (DUF4034)